MIRVRVLVVEILNPKLFPNHERHKYLTRHGCGSARIRGPLHTTLPTMSRALHHSPDPAFG